MTAKGDKAYLSNYPELQNWLDENDARCNYQILRGKLDQHHEHIESWSIGAGQFLIVVRSHRLGWDIYTSLNDVRIPETFADAAHRLKLPVKP